MFPSSISNEAIALATSAAERGIAINSAADSFLDNLVALSKNGIDTMCPSMDAEGTRLDRTNEFANPQNVDAVHSQFTDEAAVSIGEIVSRNIMVARTDAIPLIKTIMEEFEQVINPDIPYAYRRRSVVPVPFHPIWQNNYVIEAGDTYADGVNAGQVPQGLILSTEEEQFTNFLELTKTGLPQVDKQLDELLKTYDDERLKELFKSCFTSGYLDTVRGPGSLSGAWINDQILLHVWARNLVDKHPEKSSHNLTAYQNGINIVLQRTGNNIWNINKIRQNCADGNVMILAYEGDQVMVHSDIYTEWLKKGGSPEIVLGASLLTGQLRPSNGEELLAMAPALLAKWNDYVSVSSRTEQESLNAQARIELFRLIRNHVDRRKAEGLVAVYEDSMMRLNACIDRLPTNFIKDPYCFIRDMVLETFYTGTEVGMFIMNMDEICDDDDDLSEDEVAFLATVNYVTDWAAGLLVTKGGQR